MLVCLCVCEHSLYSIQQQDHSIEYVALIKFLKSHAFLKMDGKTEFGGI